MPKNNEIREGKKQSIALTTSNGTTTEQTEIWKDITGYEGKYQISSLGRVKALTFHGKPSVRILNNRVGRNGYYQVNLWQNGVSKCWYVHRLVAIMFIPNPNNLPVIDHVNTIIIDNRVANLIWTTTAGNVNNPISSAKRTNTLRNVRYKFSGTNSPVHKKVFQYNQDGTFVKEWDTISEASRSLGINGTSISSVCKGKPKRKTAGGFVWRYKKEHVPVTPSLSRPVQIFKNNILVGEWDCIKNCIKEHIIPRNRLKACLRGEENSWNGYYCRYKNKIDYSKK